MSNKYQRPWWDTLHNSRVWYGLQYLSLMSIYRKHFCRSLCSVNHKYYHKCVKTVLSCMALTVCISIGHLFMEDVTHNFPFDSPNLKGWIREHKSKRSVYQNQTNHSWRRYYLYVWFQFTWIESWKLFMFLWRIYWQTRAFFRPFL